MTNTTNRRYSLLRLAALHTAVTEYFTEEANPLATQESLQTLWHKGFESFGPAFATAVDSVPED